MVQRLRNPGLVAKFGLTMLVPVIALALVLGKTLSGAIRDRSLEEAQRQATTIARLAVDRQLPRRDVSNKLTKRQARRVSRVLRPLVRDDRLSGVTVWNRSGVVIYARGDRSPRAPSAPEVSSAIAGSTSSRVAASSRRGAKEREVLRVVTPLRATKGGKGKGAVELALPYDPIAEDIGSDTRTLFVILLAGLGILYFSLFRIISGASSRLERQAVEKEHQAQHDALTGLPNRALFHRMLEDALEACPSDKKVAVMLMDLDRFKEINDNLGHFNGDLLIERVGKRLRTVLRKGDTVARLGGDEFAMLLPNVMSRDEVASAVDRVEKALEEPFTAGGLALKVEASIGIAMYPQHGKRVGAVLQAADVAMYAAKKAHTGHEFYSPEQHQYSPARLGLAAELRRAIEEKELVLHYQPKANLATGSVNAVEALARWNHPHRGLLPPDEFIPVAEHTSLIRPLTLHLLETALTDAASWREQGYDLRVAVNLSTQILLDLKLSQEVARILKRVGAKPSSLELEITESSIMYDPRRAKLVLDELHKMGVRISIDDFGTGYSSLVSLKQLPVSAIKIDKSFVMGMQEDEDDLALVRSTVQLGQNLGLEVIAEGMEDRAAWSLLAGMGCDYGQGYYLSRPIDAARFRQWLSAYQEMFASRPKAASNGSAPTEQPQPVVSAV